jgi:ribonuclease HI
MKQSYPQHNRQLPLAQKYQDLIAREEMRRREEIIVGRCQARASAESQTPTPVPEAEQAAVTIHVATYMRLTPGPGSYAITEDGGATVELETIEETELPRLQLQAMHAAMRHLRPEKDSGVIYTTAKWIADCLNAGYVANWKANDWTKANGNSVANEHLWLPIQAIYEIREPVVVHAAAKDSPAMRQCVSVARRPFHSRSPLFGCMRGREEAM